MKRQRMLGTKTIEGIQFSAFRDGVANHVYISDHQLIIIKRYTVNRCLIGIGQHLIDDEKPVMWLKSTFKYEYIGVQQALKELKKKHNHV